MYMNCPKDTYMGVLCSPLTWMTPNGYLTHQFIDHNPFICHQCKKGPVRRYYTNGQNDTYIEEFGDVLYD